jgi:menaquinone-specific isochorismate synthase
MADTIEAWPVADHSTIKGALLHRLETALKDFHAGETPLFIVRAEILVEGISALAWLAAQRPMARGYWSDRENEFELAGIGRADMIAGRSPADVLSLMPALQQRLGTAAGSIRYFGGMRFSDRSIRDPAWDPFMGFRFILPRFEMVRHSGMTTLAVNMRSDDDLQRVRKELEQLAFPAGESASALPAPVLRMDLPNFDHWTRAVCRALAGMEEGMYEKIVLARRVTLAFDRPVSPPALLAALKKHTRHSFHFSFQPDPHHAFVGASPERLYRRDGHRLRSEAIAGTRARGSDPVSDERLGRALRTSEKDLREHQYVVNGIRQALAPLVEDLVFDPRPELLKLWHAQHLKTSMRAVLRPQVDDADLLMALHPTPAVGGYPREDALTALADLEFFDRGYYAAPVGWLDRDSAQFAVGIRSGLIEHGNLHLYSGAGVVAGSDPEQEWREIEDKIQDFLGVLPAPPTEGRA